MIPIYSMKETDRATIFARGETGADVSGTVSAIIADVRARGDAALREYTARFDRADLEDPTVNEAEMAEALAAVEPRFLDVLREAARRIRAFHSRQVRHDFVINDQPGVVLGQRVIPLERVGLYVPGGTASYPSSVLMNAIPASIAGVDEVIMVTPPGPDGKINPVILAAAHIAGVGRSFKMGGAQAVAALAMWLRPSGRSTDLWILI